MNGIWAAGTNFPSIETHIQNTNFNNLKKNSIQYNAFQNFKRAFLKSNIMLLHYI